jgi:hypothetical protein
MKPAQPLKQDIDNGTDISRPGAVRRPILAGMVFAVLQRYRAVVMKGTTDRERVQAGRRSRQATPRPHLVKFFLADEELAELSAAARASWSLG